MDKGLTVQKWVLIIRPKIPQMPKNLSAQFVCPSPKVLNFNEKRLHWASVVHGFTHYIKKSVRFSNCCGLLRISKMFLQKIFDPIVPE